MFPVEGTDDIGGTPANGDFIPGGVVPVLPAESGRGKGARIPGGVFPVAGPEPGRCTTTGLDGELEELDDLGGGGGGRVRPVGGPASAPAAAGSVILGKVGNGALSDGLGAPTFAKAPAGQLGI